MTSAAPLLAALAGALGVAGAWEALAAVEQAAVVRGAARLLAPLRAAGRQGREPSAPERRRPPPPRRGTLLAGGWRLVGPPAGLVAAGAGPWLLRRLVAARRPGGRAELGRGGAAPAPAPG